jgi:hypothetical protein
LVNAINTRLANLERKNPKNISNGDTLVDAELERGEGGGGGGGGCNRKEDDE